MVLRGQKALDWPGPGWSSEILLLNNCIQDQAHPLALPSYSDCRTASWVSSPAPWWQLLRYKFWSWRCHFVCWSEPERCTFVGCVATGWSDSSGSCSCTGCQQRSEVLDWSSWKVKCDSDFAFLPADSLSCKPKVVNFSFCLNVSVGKCRIYAFGNEVFFWIDYYQPGCLQTGAIEQNISVLFFSTSSIQTGFQRSEACVSCCLPFTQYCM